MRARLARAAAALVAFSAVLLSPVSAASFTAEDVVAAHKRAQEEVSSSWAYDPNLACTSAGVHGRVQKLASGSKIEKIFRRGTNMDPALPDIAAGVPMLSGIQVYISDKYKFIYIRQPKSSSSSIMASLWAMYCETKPCGTHEFQRLRAVNISDDVWMSYFVFTAVRNPIMRMLSAYNMFKDILRRRDPGSPEPGDFCIPPFAEYAESVLRLRTTCDTDQCCSFVKGGGGKYSNEFVDTFVNAHISGQAHAIFTPAGESVVDYIARTEHMEEDWQEVSRLIAERSGEAVPFQPMARKNVKRSGAAQPIAVLAGRKLAQLEGSSAAAAPAAACLSAAAAEVLNATTMYGLAMQFALDVTLLKYRPSDQAGLPSAAPPVSAAQETLPLQSQAPVEMAAVAAVPAAAPTESSEPAKSAFSWLG